MITANEETSTTSTHAYAIGDFFRLNGVLYKATTAIAINDTITVGTNCIATTIKNELGTGGGGGSGVGDVQVNGTSITSNGIANIPIATSSAPGVVRFASNANYGIWYKNSPEEDVLRIASAGGEQVKAGSSDYLPITPSRQHLAAFYGLSRAANVNLAAENVTLGTYPDASKAAIQSMLGVSNMIAPVESDSTADRAYIIGDIFCYNGKLYKATAAIAESETIIPTTNCTETSLEEDSKWSGFILDRTSSYYESAVAIPFIHTTKVMKVLAVTTTPAPYRVPKYDGDSCLISTTPTAGDSSTKVATTAFVSNAISSAIPSVTSSDNGKFLQVVNGAWAAVTIANANGVSF